MISLGQSWAVASSQFNLGDIYCTYYSKDTALWYGRNQIKLFSALKELKIQQKVQLCPFQICHPHPPVFSASANGATIYYVTKVKNVHATRYSLLFTPHIHFLQIVFPKYIMNLLTFCITTHFLSLAKNKLPQNFSYIKQFILLMLPDSVDQGFGQVTMGTGWKLKTSERTIRSQIHWLMLAGSWRSQFLPYGSFLMVSLHIVTWASFQHGGQFPTE